jgi:uncharacterized protein YceK
MARTKGTIAGLVFLVCTAPGCMSVLSNTAMLQDRSELGTPYSGSRRNLHTLVCFGRDVAQDASALLFAPIMLFPLIDLPLSFVVDTLILPIDVAVDADKPPLEIGKGDCRLFGM